MRDSKAHWDNIYKDKSFTDLSWYQLRPNISLDLINRAHVPLDESIIDVGGGLSSLVEYLSEAGYRKLAVLDISSNAIASLQHRLGEKALQIEWFAMDVKDFRSEHTVALWHDRAVFHFLTDKADREKYIKVLHRTLSENGYLIIATFSLDGPRQCSGLDIVQYDAAKLQAELGDSFEMVEQQAELHITPSDAQQKFNYFLFKKR